MRPRFRNPIAVAAKLERRGGPMRARQAPRGGARDAAADREAAAEGLEEVRVRCLGGCTFWRCGRDRGHPGPCYPPDRPEDR